MTLHAGRGEVTQLDAAALARTLHRRLVAQGGSASRADIFTDDNALIAQVTGPLALPKLAGKCSEMFPIGPRQAVIRTSADPKDWEESMRGWREEDAKAAVMQIRHKKLVQEGAIWAAAPAGPQKLRQDDGTGLSGRLAVQLRGPEGARPAQLIRALTDALGRAVGRPFAVAGEGEPLGSYMLRPQRGR